MRRGIVVGKFMPLHRGHQLLIETALAHVDELTIGVYNTHLGQHWERLMPPEKRAQWVSKLYPSVKNIVVLPEPAELRGVIENVQDLNEGKYSPLYAKQVEFLGPFDYCFTSESYGAPWAAAMGAEHIQVDAARELVPVSGTVIRENAYNYRGLIDPIVYRDLIRKVVFVGTESTGKSTLAKFMAEEMDTLWCHEFGRELWEAQDGGGIFPDFLKIAQMQRMREQNAALHSNRFLFCDTNAWTTLQWCEMYYGGIADQRLRDLVDSTINDYIWFFCDNDFGWVDDGSRELEGIKSSVFQERQRLMLNHLWHSHGLRYTTLSGSLEERVTQVKLGLALHSGDLVTVK